MKDDQGFSSEIKTMTWSLLYYNVKLGKVYVCYTLHTKATISLIATYMYVKRQMCNAAFQIDDSLLKIQLYNLVCRYKIYNRQTMGQWNRSTNNVKQFCVPNSKKMSTIHINK